jgi:hypothetical protein
VKFKFNRNAIKKKIQYQPNTIAMKSEDDKELFKWTATIIRTTFEKDYKLRVEGNFHDKVIISNVKLYKINCDNSLNSLEILTHSPNTWSVQNALKHDSVFSDGCDASEIEFRLTADLYLREPLQLVVSKSVLNQFENAKYSDLDIVVKDEIFHVHKAILMERSPVFEAMVIR